MPYLTHNQANQGQCPDALTTDQLASQDNQDYPSATSLREGLERVETLTSPFGYRGLNLRLLPYREGKWNY